MSINLEEAVVRATDKPGRNDNPMSIPNQFRYHQSLLSINEL